MWLVRGAWNNALVSKGDFIQLYIDKSVADADVQEELDEKGLHAAYWFSS